MLQPQGTFLFVAKPFPDVLPRGTHCAQREQLASEIGVSTSSVSRSGPFHDSETRKVTVTGAALPPKGKKGPSIPTDRPENTAVAASSERSAISCWPEDGELADLLGPEQGGEGTRSS